MWVGPYESLIPGWTLVVRDDQKLVGYLNGCPNTHEFEWRRRILHDWALAARVVAGRFPNNQDTQSFLLRCCGLEQAPNQRFSREVREALRKTFPAHLHMNLTGEYRGQGIGLLLLEEYFKRLREARIAGVHVHCDQAPLGFYQKAGLDLLERQQLPDGKSIFVLTKELN